MKTIKPFGDRDHLLYEIELDSSDLETIKLVFTDATNYEQTKEVKTIVIQDPILLEINKSISYRYNPELDKSGPFDAMTLEISYWENTEEIIQAKRFDRWNYDLKYIDGPVYSLVIEPDLCVYILFRNYSTQVVVDVDPKIFLK